MANPVNELVVVKSGCGIFQDYAMVIGPWPYS